MDNNIAPSRIPNNVFDVINLASLKPFVGVVVVLS